MAKARTAKLKVFRTPVGFHDAYVAAPSQKAALEAWGVDSNLFAAGAAEVVTDPELTKEPLASPGTVIRKLRGSEREHVAALGATGAARAKKTEGRAEPRLKPKPETKAKKPSRAALERVEAALAAHLERHGRAVERLRQQEAALAERRRQLERAGAAERRQLENRLDEERARYEEALDEWERTI